MFPLTNSSRTIFFMTFKEAKNARAQLIECRNINKSTQKLKKCKICYLVHAVPCKKAKNIYPPFTQLYSAFLRFCTWQSEYK
jgi:hypothetical protein